MTTAERFHTWTRLALVATVLAMALLAVLEWVGTTSRLDGTWIDEIVTHRASTSVILIIILAVLTALEVWVSARARRDHRSRETALEIEVAEARRDADQMRDTIDDLNSELDQIRPRFVSVADREKLAAQLRCNSQEPVGIYSHYGDGEALALARMLGDIFDNAGWVVLSVGPAVFSGSPTRGIFIQGWTDEQLRCAGLIYGVFESFGLNPELARSPGPDHLQVIVGHR